MYSKTKKNSDLLNILSTKKVLYAEDEPGVAKNTIEILEIFFEKVVYVQDGQEALDEFEYNSYDALILDICMPNMDGIEAIERIREFDHKVPIIILSAFTQQEYLWRAVELKIVKYLTKPYDTDSFLNALEKVCLELVDYHVYFALTSEHRYDLSRKVVLHKGNVIRLSKNESRFLEYMIDRKNQIVSFDDLYEYVWEFEEPSKEAVKSVVKELRRKIGKDFIKNVYGVGYTLEI